MISRKQEERNEKVIRGLLKLPPNRRCINCDSMGPQYVCTNFWTFVCMTCSGIHREFTHRVKSVSMSKFTTEEVEALQNGGNQRAREIYLKDWDPHMERLPNNSNAEKVRQFIKDVYLDRKYAGENNYGKPPKDKQKLKNHEDETRRASSYHSYSQSPPYDYQYEERRYGKQAAPSLSRKPGSDRGIYERKAAYGGFLSPSHLSDHVSEKSSVSDYSVSSGGDPFRSGPQSPSFQREVGYNSPSNAGISSLEIQQDGKLNTFADNKAPPLQRTVSVDSDRSLNSIASNSVNSSYNVNAITSSASANFDGLDLFSAPFVSQTVTSTAAAAIDLFQLPHALSTSSVPNTNSNITSQNSLPPSLSLFPDPPQQQENEGWATFDRPQTSELSQAFDDPTPATIPYTVGEKIDQIISPNTNPQQPSYEEIHGSSSSSKTDQFILPNTSLQQPSFPEFHGSSSTSKTDQFIFPNTSLQQPSFPEFHGSSSSLMHNQWDANHQNVGALFNAIITPQHSWNAFEDTRGQQDFQDLYQQGSSQAAVQNPSSIADQYHGFGVLEDSNKNETETAMLSNDPIFGVSSHAGVQSHAPDQKSTNPFDLPYASDMESDNMFLEMSSLQSALPNGQMPNSLVGGVNPWFPEDPLASFGPQGALGFMGPHVPSPQIQNIPTQAPVASSFGGNPFA